MHESGVNSMLCCTGCSQAEKYSMLRVYRKPRHYGLNLTRVVISLLPYCLIFNLLFACWMLSNPETSPSVLIDEVSVR